MAVPDDRPHVLIADDQADVLESLRLLLGPEGFRTEAVTTPEQVVKRIGQDGVDLLLMDLNYTRDTTSGAEGLTLIDRIREIEPLVPIVAMTGWSTVELAVEAMRKGIRHFVQKPWDNDALVSLIRDEVEEGRVRRRRARQQRRELEEARAVQRSLLPRTLPVVPGLELAVHWEPARGVGGDAFDVVLLGEQQLALSVADVAGKGIPAALLMSSMQAIVRAHAADGDPAAVCGRVNALLAGQLPDDRFVTFVLAAYDTATRRLRYCNAGHNPPLLVRPDGGIVRLDAGGPVLGILRNAVYEAADLTLAPGDRLVLYTDGIVEAGRGDEEFGEARLIDALESGRGCAARELVGRIVDAVGAFADDGEERTDDRTVVVLAIE
ncbi:MAG TPA: SpoIIE family protein phosphatase [Vicinamibacterales bacterium]